MDHEIDRELQLDFQLVLQTGTVKQGHGRSGLNEQVDIATAGLIVETGSEQIDDRRFTCLTANGS